MQVHPQPVIAAIVAMSLNRVIGKNNQLPWHLPADLKHFKQITLHHPIIMGRKTYASIGKPLPDRLNIVISRDRNFQAPGCVVVNSLEAALTKAQAEKTDEVFIIGGANIYEQALPAIERIYLTQVEATFDGDVFFPALNAADWREISREDYLADERNPYDYRFITLERRKLP